LLIIRVYTAVEFAVAEREHTDDILKFPPSRALLYLTNCNPELFHGFDKFGRPIYWVKTGRMVPYQLKVRMLPAVYAQV